MYYFPPVDSDFIIHYGAFEFSTIFANVNGLTLTIHIKLLIEYSDKISLQIIIRVKLCHV